MVYLAELFPNAKFIFMLRDGRASAHSGWFRFLQCVCNRFNASPNNQQFENHF